MDLGLTNRVAIVAAGSRGLGLAVAEELAAEGAAVVICARAREARDAVRGEGADLLATDVVGQRGANGGRPSGAARSCPQAGPIARAASSFFMEPRRTSTWTGLPRASSFSTR